MKSVFTDKDKIPTDIDLKSALGETYQIWQQIVEFTKQEYPNVKTEWSYSSAKFGWSFRLKDSKRVIVYLLPRIEFFKVAFVFGQKATDTINSSTILPVIKVLLNQAKSYAEGRGVRFEVKDNDLLIDIKQLILIKLDRNYF
jgi:hypothetical protein